MVLYWEELSFFKLRGSTKTAFYTGELWGWSGRFFRDGKCSVEPVEGGSQTVKSDKHTKRDVKSKIYYSRALSAFVQELAVERK